jgi:hypothetical protein
VTQPLRRSELVVAVALVVSFAALGIRFFAFIHDYAATLLIQDQWGILSGFIDGRTGWQLFGYQHGPHRQGLGSLALAFVLWVSDWDGVAIALLTGASIAAAALVAVFLKWRCFHRLDLVDVAIPILFFNLAQHETLTAIPNPAHSAIPLLLVVVHGLALTAPDLRARCAGMLVVTFFALFTGFGLFLGLVTPAILVLELLGPDRTARERGWLWVGLGVVAAEIGLFFAGYDWQPTILSELPDLTAASAVGFPFSRVLALGAEGWWSRLAAMAIVAVLVGALVFNVAKSIGAGRDDDAHRVAAALLLFSLLFAASTALERSSNYLSRYATLAVPGLLGLYFTCRTLRAGVRWRGAGIAVLVLLAILVLRPRPDDRRFAAAARNGRALWAACYVKSRDLPRCQRRIGSIHSSPELVGLQQKLDFMEQNALNLFHPRLQARIEQRASDLVASARPRRGP